MPEKDLAGYKRRYLGAGLLAGLLLLWASLQRTPLNASKYEGGVTLLCYVAYMVFAMGFIQFFRAKRNMYLRDCTQMRALILWGGMIFFILQALNVLLGGLFLITNGATILSLLVVAANALSAVLALTVFIAQNKLTYREISGKKLIEGHFEKY